MAVVAKLACMRPEGWWQPGRKTHEIAYGRGFLCHAARFLKNEYKHRKTWKGLSKFEATKYYYVVTQGGYYSIRGFKLIEPYMSEVTRIAVKNGFVVATENEAEDLQRAIQRLGW